MCSLYLLKKFLLWPLAISFSLVGVISMLGNGRTGNKACYLALFSQSSFMVKDVPVYHQEGIFSFLYLSHAFNFSEDPQNLPELFINKSYRFWVIMDNRTLWCHVHPESFGFLPIMKCFCGWFKGFSLENWRSACKIMTNWLTFSSNMWVQSTYLPT